MRKISMLLVILMSALLLTSPIYAVAEENIDTAIVSSNESMEEALDERPGNASETTINRVLTKEEKIQKNTEKCGGEKSLGTVLYYLEMIQKYSVPVCFIGLTIASLNFFIIGNKKLEKREQGFSMLIMFGLGLIMFQVLPLLFAIIVAGR